MFPDGKRYTAAAFSYFLFKTLRVRKEEFTSTHVYQYRGQSPQVTMHWRDEWVCRVFYTFTYVRLREALHGIDGQH